MMINLIQGVVQNSLGQVSYRCPLRVPHSFTGSTGVRQDRCSEGAPWMEKSSFLWIQQKISLFWDANSTFNKNSQLEISCLWTKTETSSGNMSKETPTCSWLNDWQLLISQLHAAVFLLQQESQRLKMHRTNNIGFDFSCVWEFTFTRIQLDHYTTTTWVLPGKPIQCFIHKLSMKTKSRNLTKLKIHQTEGCIMLMAEIQLTSWGWYFIPLFTMVFDIPTNVHQSSQPHDLEPGAHKKNGKRRPF